MEKKQKIGRGVMKSLTIKQLLLASMFVILSFSCAEKRQPTLNALIADLKASSYVNKKEAENALNTYFEILETDTDLPSVHSNIGILFLESKKPEEALKSLQQALKLAEQNKDLKSLFVIRYNLGVYFGLLKKVPEALENYQAALELKPDSTETKHNIELLIQEGSKESSGDKNEKKENKDGKGGGQGEQDQKDKKDQDGDEKDEKNKKDKDYAGSPKYKPRPFKSGELSEGDVKKILGELKNQEQKIRANFDKKERKDKKNEKDW